MRKVEEYIKGDATFLIIQVPKETYKCAIDGSRLVIMKGYEFYQEWDYEVLPDGIFKITTGSNPIYNEILDYAINKGLAHGNKKLCILERQ